MNGAALQIDLAAIGEDVPLLEGIRTLRAIRRLRSDPVPPGLVRKVCEAGTFAPSGGNRQPWIFVALTTPEGRAFVAERYRRAFHAYIAPALEAAKAPPFPEEKRRNIRAALHLADHLAEV
ncbi:MAG TPA: nitroreductase family protein, partial [Myxococcota bacterium]|nr:nitroreductase family protein [Myxococcota bacterium]